MKYSKSFKYTAIATVILSASYASADNVEYSFSGEARSGILVTQDATRGSTLTITPNGRFRLGNEDESKFVIKPTVKYTMNDGAWAKAAVNITHQTYSTADWGSDTSGTDRAVEIREGYVEMGGLDFAPGVTFWAGKRMSPMDISNHQYDWEYIQYNGTGGGFDNLDLGFAKWDFGIYSFTQSDDASNRPAKYEKKQGYSSDYSVNTWLKGIGGSKLDLEFMAHRMELPQYEQSINRADKGIGVTALYSFDGWYNLMEGGYSKLAAQYGTGMAAGDSLGKNGWGWGNNKDTKSFRIVLDGLLPVAQNLELGTFAYFQKDKDYNPWSDGSDLYDLTTWAVGVRPHHQITPHFAMQYEVSYERRKETGHLDEVNNIDGGLMKFTIAPTLTLKEGFWGRPQIRFFATYAKWDEDVKAKLDSAYNSTDKTDTFLFGVQAETWF